MNVEILCRIGSRRAVYEALDWLPDLKDSCNVSHSPRDTIKRLHAGDVDVLVAESHHPSLPDSVPGYANYIQTLQRATLVVAQDATLRTVERYTRNFCLAEDGNAKFALQEIYEGATRTSLTPAQARTLLLEDDFIHLFPSGVVAAMTASETKTPFVLLADVPNIFDPNALTITDTSPLNFADGHIMLLPLERAGILSNAQVWGDCKTQRVINTQGIYYGRGPLREMVPSNVEMPLDHSEPWVVGIREATSGISSFEYLQVAS